jgi:hypothetical protein
MSALQFVRVATDVGGLVHSGEGIGENFRRCARPLGTFDYGEKPITLAHIQAAIGVPNAPRVRLHLVKVVGNFGWQLHLKSPSKPQGYPHGHKVSTRPQIGRQLYNSHCEGRGAVSAAKAEDWCRAGDWVD